MDSVLERSIVLSLNANWQVIGWRTPRETVIAMCGGAYGGTPPALAVSIEMDENGELTEAIPLKWDEWVKLPVRPQDLSIQTKSGPIRCPTVCVAPNFKHIPVKSIRLTKQAIIERDGGVCQYSGEKLPRSKLNIDHVIPQAKGGRDTWDNLVTCSKDINSMKGDKMNNEIGLKLIRKPQTPKPVPVSFHINQPRMPEHTHFLIK